MCFLPYACAQPCSVLDAITAFRRSPATFTPSPSNLRSEVLRRLASPGCWCAYIKTKASMMNVATTAVSSWLRFLPRPSISVCDRLSVHHEAVAPDMHLSSRCGKMAVSGAHAVRTFLRLGQKHNKPRAALFTDIESAYYATTRELSFRRDGSIELLLTYWQVSASPRAILQISSSV